MECLKLRAVWAEQYNTERRAVSLRQMHASLHVGGKNKYCMSSAINWQRDFKNFLRSMVAHIFLLFRPFTLGVFLCLRKLCEAEAIMLHYVPSSVPLSWCPCQHWLVHKAGESTTHMRRNHMTARGLIFSSLVYLRAVPITGVTPSVPRVSCVNLCKWS